jgi:hypothetical protein
MPGGTTACRPERRRDWVVRVAQSSGNQTTEVFVSWQAALSLGIPALVAVAGYLLTYRNNLRLSERKDRLDRVRTGARGFSS